MLYLTKIIISPSNGQFKFIDDKYLIGKSESNNDELDNLLFVRRNIKEISIPLNIKIISPYAFHNYIIQYLSWFTFLNFFMLIKMILNQKSILYELF